MSDRNFSRRRRGGMRFRPPGGVHGNIKRGPDRAAQDARAEAIGAKSGDENIYDRRFNKEVERAENVAAGLPPEGAPAEGAGKKDFRQPHLDTPAEVKEEAYQPVQLKDQPPQGIVEAIKAAANKVIRKVQRLIKPKQKS